MAQRIVQVDAFTSQPFRGNPAAVCTLEGEAEADWMQRVALEMNLSETAFLWPEGDSYRLRWFTPLAEVDLCGHATLAAAHVLWEEGHLSASEVARFATRSGMLLARLEQSKIVLDFPASDIRSLDDETTETALAAALGCSLDQVFRTRFDVLVAVRGEDVLRSLRPDLAALARIDVRGVIVTCRGRDVDFVSRFFAPAVGVPEDPVTGSAHCALAPYWSPVLGKQRMRAAQLSARGGELEVELEGDRVRLLGEAVTTLRGELLV